jgi:hypothetical protein
LENLVRVLQIGFAEEKQFTGKELDSNRVARLILDNELFKLEQKLVQNENAIAELSSGLEQSREFFRMLCDETWELYGLSCYKVFNDEDAWQDAVEKCKLEGAFLVEIGSSKENDFVIKLFNQSIATVNSSDAYQGPWIGASDIETEGEWIWQHNGQNLETGYQEWHKDEPNGNTTENCLHLLETANLKWNDSPCDYDKPYVCEKSVNLK